MKVTKSSYSVSKLIGLLLHAKSIKLAALVAVLGLVVINNPSVAQENFVTPGPNVNAVGTTPDYNILRIPDLFRKQQNEPSCRSATDNPADIVCGFNDCRAADWPEVQGDCWIGVGQSRDFGKTWTSRLAPGYLGHPDSVNMGFAADPALVEAPGNSPGVMYLTYIASYRDSDVGGIFTQTYVKSPLEDGEPYLPVIGQPSTTAFGSEGRFHDKVAAILVVDENDPQSSSAHTFFLEGVVDEDLNPRPVTINLVDHVHIVAYSVFTGEGSAVKILTRRCVNGGPCEKPKKASSELNTVTGVHLSYIQGEGLTLTYRRSGDSNEPDGIVSVHSDNLARTWSKPEDVGGAICPMDSQASGSTLRNFTFPWGAATDDRYWVFWADKVMVDPDDPDRHGKRVAALGECTQVPGAPLGTYPGVSRIVGMSSEDGKNWYGAVGSETEPFILDFNNGVGYQIFPFSQGTKNRVDIAWWDTREEDELLGRPVPVDAFAKEVEEFPYIYDYQTLDAGILTRVFRTANIYMTRISGCLDTSPLGGCTPNQPINDPTVNLVSPVRISRYQTRDVNGVVQELEANRLNLRTHGSGRLAYTGDYGSIGTRTFRRLTSGRVIPNSLGEQVGLENFVAEENMVVAWGENRDVFGDFVGDPGDPLVQFLYAAPVLQAPVLQAPVFQANNDSATDSSESLLADETGSEDPTDSVESLLAGDETDLKAVNEPDDGPGAGPTDDAPDTCTVANLQRSYARDSGVYVSYVEDKPSMVALSQARRLNTTQRMIPLFISYPGTNPLGENFCLHIAQRPADWENGEGSGRASFLPRPALNNPDDPASTPVLEFLDVHVGPKSSASRSVFITSSDPTTRVIVNAHAGFCPDPQVPGVPPSGELISSVQIGDGELFDPVFCQQNPTAPACINSVASSESHNISEFLEAPSLQAPVLQAPSLQALSLGSPVLQAPSFQATGFQAQGEEAPVLQAPSFQATNYEANSLLSPSLQAPSFQAPSLQAAGEGDIYYQDLTHTVVTSGNVTTTYSADIAVLGLDPLATDVDLIAWQPNVHTATGTDADGDCVPAAEASIKVIAAVDMEAPVFQAPSLQAPGLGDVSLPFAFPDDGEGEPGDDQEPFIGDITFPGKPGDLINLTTRIWVTGDAKVELDRLNECKDSATPPATCSPAEIELGPFAVLAFGAAAHGCSINGFTIPGAGGDCISADAEKIEPPDLFEPFFIPDSGTTFAHEAEADVNGDCCAVSTPGTVPVGISVTDQSPVTVTCSSSGVPLGDVTTTFEFGDTTVNCVATDQPGNQSTADYLISIIDETNPVINVPADITTGAETASGVPVTFVVTADDVTVTTIECKITGTETTVTSDVTLFLPGTTNVTCTATDVGGNTASDSFNVIVNDIGNPTISVSITTPDYPPAEATSAAGASVTFDVTALDDIDDDVASECKLTGTNTVVESPHTFSYVPPGPTTTSVTCTAMDDAVPPNTASTTFDVIVDDMTPPDIDMPGDITGIVIGATVNYEDHGFTVSDDVDPDPVVNCDTASGSVFNSLGTTPVSCTATDNSNNTSAATTFNVTVDQVNPGGITAKRSVKAGSSDPVRLTWEDGAQPPNTIFVGPADETTHSIEAHEAPDGTCPGIGNDLILEDPGSSFWQLLEGNIYGYNWQTPDDASGPHCIKVTLLATGQSQETVSTIR
jgi:hypothetical protein